MLLTKLAAQQEARLSRHRRLASVILILQSTSLAKHQPALVQRQEALLHQPGLPAQTQLQPQATRAQSQGAW